MLYWRGDREGNKKAKYDRALAKTYRLTATDRVLTDSVPTDKGPDRQGPDRQDPDSAGKNNI